MGFFNPFGGGASGSGGTGVPGRDGRGISSIVFLSSTEGTTPGLLGATDTYQIEYTDGTTSTYVVKNGEGSAPRELTQEEFDALLEGDKKDKVFFIKDRKIISYNDVFYGQVDKFLLTDDTTGKIYQFGIDNGTTYFREYNG